MSKLPSDPEGAAFEYPVIEIANLLARAQRLQEHPPPGRDLAEGKKVERSIWMMLGAVPRKYLRR